MRCNRSFLLLACFVLSCFVCLQNVSASGDLYMAMQEGVKKCFIEEVPKNTLVLVKFKGVEAKPPVAVEGREPQPIGWKITVHDPIGSVKLFYFFSVTKLILYTLHSHSALIMVFHPPPSPNQRFSNSAEEPGVGRSLRFHVSNWW